MKKLFQTFLISMLLVSFSGFKAHAEDPPKFAVRVNLGGYEAEWYVGTFGFMYGLTPDFYASSVTACKPVADRSYFTARRFFMKKKDYDNGWYLGLTSYKDNLIKAGSCTPSQDTKGVVPTFGYRWVWKSGLEMELGLRQNIIAIGFAF